MNLCVCCLWAVQVLKRSVTRSPCAVEIILDTSVERKHRCLSPPCPWNFPEKVCGFDLKLASGGNKWKAATIHTWFSGPVQTFKREKPRPSGCAVLPPAGWHPVLASWIRAAEQEAKSAWPQLFVWLKLKPCSLSPEMYPKWWECVCLTWYICGLFLRFSESLSFLTMAKDNTCTRRNYALLKQDLARSLWLWLRLYNDDGLLSFSAPLLSSASLHLSPSLSLIPWPVKIHTGIQPCGKSDKTSVELHRLGGMYVANDFQRLMTRKEVENLGGGERRMKASRGRSSRRGEEERKKKTLNWASMKHSWMFRQRWRLLIKAKYWSFSSLLSPPPWFSSLYCWPPEEKRAQSLDGRSLNKWDIAGTGFADNEWLCVLMCVLFGQAPSHPIWVSS